MSYGLYLSASGVLTNMYRQDVLAHNLANVQTVGYKPDLPVIRQRPAEALEKDHPSEFRQALLDRIGGGALAGRQTINFDRGAVQATGNGTDVALAGENAFFTVQTTDRRTGATQVRLTRDGRFTVARDGRLVTAADGNPVLDVDGRSITLQPGRPVQFNQNGDVIQNGTPVARLQVTGVTDPQRLVKTGHNLLWSLDGADPRTTAADASVYPASVESSAVDPIKTLIDLTNATKAITLNGNMIRYQDELMDRAVNTLGRIS